jgi:hypothetical protein
MPHSSNFQACSGSLGTSKTAAVVGILLIIPAKKCGLGRKKKPVIEGGIFPPKF